MGGRGCVRALIDELTYRVYSNAGPVALAPMKPGCFMIARIVPIETGWMLSGTQQTLDALPFRRLAGADTGRASQLFQHLLKKPGFSWERDGEALLRKHKPWCFEANPAASGHAAEPRTHRGSPVIQVGQPGIMCMKS